MKKREYKLSFGMLFVIWVALFLLCVVLLVVDGATPGIVTGSAWNILNLVIAFVTFMVTSLFSMALLRDSRDNRRNNDDINARSESFRTLSFISSNYAVVDFVDYVLLYGQYDDYVKNLKDSGNFTLYLRDASIALADIRADTDAYKYLSLRIPVQQLDGRNMTSINISDFTFHKNNKQFRFVPCTKERNTLILFNKKDRRNEIAVNLIVKDAAEFFAPDKVVPFTKISFTHTMISLLGVAVSGSTEIYLENPQKVKGEKGEVSQYAIHSTQFRISELPVLLTSINDGISNMTN